MPPPFAFPLLLCSSVASFASATRACHCAHPVSILFLCFFMHANACALKSVRSTSSQIKGGGKRAWRRPHGRHFRLSVACVYKEGLIRLIVISIWVLPGVPKIVLFYYARSACMAVAGPSSSHSISSLGVVQGRCAMITAVSVTLLFSRCALSVDGQPPVWSCLGFDTHYYNKLL